MDNNTTAVSPLNFLPEIKQKLPLPENIMIYDSTLRDGEQMPGVCFLPEQKLTIAQILDEIGIPEIEAGFPAVSKTEEQTVKLITTQGLDAKILVLSRLTEGDIDAAIRSDADIILLFIASSPLHLKYKLHCTEEELKQKIQTSIDYVKAHGIIPSFSTEDSTRTPLHFLKELVLLAEECGAERIGFTDTVGCATPATIHYLFSEMRKHVSTPFSAHLHNDFGFALINALTALSAGATHICTTINGWGERAGNVPLEQLVMTLKCLYEKDLGIDTTRFFELSQKIADFTGIPRIKTQPFIGENTFTHESGIHVAAVLENPATYEPIPPEIVGNKRNLILGKHTGRRMIKHLLDAHHISASDTMIDQLISEVKIIGEKHGHLSNEHVEILLEKARQQERI